MQKTETPPALPGNVQEQKAAAYRSAAPGFRPDLGTTAAISGSKNTVPQIISQIKTQLLLARLKEPVTLGKSLKDQHLSQRDLCSFA